MLSTAALEVKHKLSFERKYAAPRDLLFEVWSQPKHILNWWGPHDHTVPSCVVDFRVGGRYKICMRSPEGEQYWASGEYKEIDEPDRIVFSLKREFQDGSVCCNTLVTVSFESCAEGTLFRLDQTGFDSAEHRDLHRDGSGEYLDRLRDYVTVPS